MGILSGRTVLVVEDESLVGLLIEDALLDAGAIVYGPANTIEIAQNLLINNAISAAILDINVGGLLVYPVADELSRQGIPFIFVSGYLKYPSQHASYHAKLVLKPFLASDIVCEVACIVDAPSR